MTEVLIADAGSTKTSWSYLDKEAGEIIRIQTEGINPAHQDTASIERTLEKVAELLSGKGIKHIFYYGAGCASPSLQSYVGKCLAKVLKPYQTKVNSDLTGAALSLFGDKKGIACILGTGSNSGLFDKGEIVSQIPSLGFILGDEGSGVSLGKRLINNVFKKQISSQVIDLFQTEYNLTVAEIIQRVYLSPKPAPYLASFATFLKKNVALPEIKNLVISEFDSFFEKNILSYKNYRQFNVGFIGSIAYNFQDLLIRSAKKYGIEKTQILKDPILSLEKYFLEK